MSVWNEIRKKSLGTTARKEEYDHQLIAKWKSEAIKYGIGYNNFANRYLSIRTWHIDDDRYIPKMIALDRMNKYMDTLNPQKLKDFRTKMYFSMINMKKKYEQRVMDNDLRMRKAENYYNQPF